MKVIKDYVDHIEDELEGAKEYAEKYVEAKAMDEISKANKYKEMANDELRHASYVHEFAVDEIKKISKVFVAPHEMLEKWEKSHAVYVEKSAWIKQMLAM